MKLLLFQLKYAAIDKVEQVLLHLLYLYLTGSTVNDESTFDMNCPSPILFSEVDRHNRDEGNPRPLLDKEYPNSRSWHQIGSKIFFPSYSNDKFSCTAYHWSVHVK